MSENIGVRPIGLDNMCLFFFQCNILIMLILNNVSSYIHYRIIENLMIFDLISTLPHPTLVDIHYRNNIAHLYPACKRSHTWQFYEICFDKYMYTSTTNGNL